MLKCDKLMHVKGLMKCTSFLGGGHKEKRLIHVVLCLY